MNDGNGESTGAIEPGGRGAAEPEQHKKADMHRDILGNPIAEANWQKCEEWYREKGHEWQQELGIENVWRKVTPPCTICTKGARRRRAWTQTSDKRWTIDNKCCTSCVISDGRIHSNECDRDNEENNRVMEMVGSMTQQVVGASLMQGLTATELMGKVDQWMQGNNGYTNAMEHRVAEIDGAKRGWMRREMSELQTLKEEPLEIYPIRFAELKDQWGVMIQRAQPKITDQNLELLMDEIMNIETQEQRGVGQDHIGIMEIKSRIKEAWSRIILRQQRRQAIEL